MQFCYALLHKPLSSLSSMLFLPEGRRNCAHYAAIAFRFRPWSIRLLSRDRDSQI